MTEQHPITPPPSVVQQWMDLPLSEEECLVVAAQWGADQELEACCEWLRTGPYGASIACYEEPMISDLRAARRAQIKLNLKEQALKTLCRICHSIEYEDYHTILLALESMPEDLPPLPDHDTTLQNL